MTDAEFDGKLDEAARLLSASAFPVVGGLATDLAGSVAAFRLAEKLGGAVDHAAAEWSLRDQAVLHDQGLMLVSPGEARQRADTFLLVGDGPLGGLARPRRLSLRAASHAFLGRPAAAADPGAVEP